MKVAIGIDIGRSPIIGILTDIKGNLRERLEIEVPMDAPFAYSIHEIRKLIKKLHKHSPDVSGLCLGTPGRIDHVRGICHYSPNFPHWKEVDLVAPFREELRIPVFAINDVKGAALGEMYYGAGTLGDEVGSSALLNPAEKFIFDSSEERQRKNIRNLILIAVGVGIGSGIIMNNELVVGKNYGAGELGHVTIEPQGPACGCGNRGCLEALCSLGAVRRDVFLRLEKKWNSLIEEYVSAPEELTFGILGLCAGRDDDIALEALSNVGKYLGRGIAVVANILDPEMVVLGGDIVPLFETLRPMIEKELKERVKIVPHEEIMISPARLGELSGAYGAAAYVFKMLYNF
jgi:glucokinase